MDLADIRKEIDEIDDGLSKLLQRRMELSVQVAQYKQQHGLPTVDEKREREVIARAEASMSDVRLKPLARRFFEGVMAESRQLQREFLVEGKSCPATLPGYDAVAYLGPEGSFSHEALVQTFGEGAHAVPAASFEEAVERVASGSCRYGILPVENSLTGGIFAVTDLLASGLLHIVGEAVLVVRHCLLGIRGAVAGDIKAVLSHPQPLEQCRQFILRRGYDTQACSSTAGAALEVARRQDMSLAAIASEAAGRLHGLELLLSDIQDNPANFTRFVIVSAGEQATEGANKISAVFVVEHRSGTLYGALRAFADRGINLLNLISRPVPGSPWQYCFHMDFDGSLEDANVQAALADAGGKLPQNHYTRQLPEVGGVT